MYTDRKEHSVNRDSLLLDLIQSGFPVEERPFNALGDMLELSEDEAFSLTGNLIDSGVIRQIGPFFDSKRLGFKSTLVAALVAPWCVDKAARYVNRFNEVTHNYLRNHKYNLWFTLIAREDSRIEEILDLVMSRDGVEALYNLPALKMFKIQVDFSITGEAKSRGEGSRKGSRGEGSRRKGSRGEASLEDRPLPGLQEKEINLIRAIQNGIPVVKKPFESVAASLGEEQSWVIQKITEWQEKGVIRRFGAALRHHRAGFIHNAMVVWLVPACDEDRIGRLFAESRSVSHCYIRPVFPDFPWNLYTMIHSRTEEGLLQTIGVLREKSGIESILVLESIKEYKKNEPSVFLTRSDS
ncbi:MAG: hypothetical protein AB2L14_24585 [Candidatus Xenobiia bacterium LiM19]